MIREGIVRINDIIEQMLSYYPEADVDMVRKAYVYSAKVHKGQTRLSGEPYLNHPLSVAKLLADIRLDEYSVSTALLHDTVEDTLATIKEIEKLFGSEIAFLVDGVTKITEISKKSRLDKEAETIRKMLFAMSKDIRVILIKLADRVHNMKTLQHLPSGKQIEIAQQTLDIYAPIAGRLGMFSMKKELEDLSVKFLHHEIYKDIDEKIAASSEQREKYVQEVIRIISDKLKQFRINARVTGRSKHIYSIYNKMLQQNLDFNQIFDLAAFRIIVDERRDCFEVLGIIHSIWKPIPGRFKDYISLPKANMYQSLHTTVIGPYGQRIEIQIRTEEMDRVAKFGIAAHWKYKEGRMIDQKHDQRFLWLHQMVETQKEVNDAKEFLDTFRVNLFPDEVYVFTPKGKVVELPKGATPVDFAYRIHTQVGNTCTGAKVNGKIVPLKHQLQSGNVVDILTTPGHNPSRDWLKFVKTARAKSKIKQWINIEQRQQYITLGREILEKDLKKRNLKFLPGHKATDPVAGFEKEGIKTVEDLYFALGHGRLKTGHVINRLFPELAEKVEEEKHPGVQSKQKASKSSDGISVGGLNNVLIRFGKCCNPVFGEKIAGFITRGRGVSIHTIECPFFDTVDPERKIDAKWDNSGKHTSRVPIRVLCEDKKGILADITLAISANETNITKAKVHTLPDKKAVNVFEVEVSALDQLDKVMGSIKQIKGVLQVTRLHA